MKNPFVWVGLAAVCFLVTACFDSSEKKPEVAAGVAATETVKAEPSVHGEGPWAMRERKQYRDEKGQPSISTPDTVVFANGETVEKVGFVAEWIATLPSKGEPKVHLIRAADCMACEAAFEIVAIQVP